MLSSSSHPLHFEHNLRGIQLRFPRDPQRKFGGIQAPFRTSLGHPRKLGTVDQPLRIQARLADSTAA